MDDNFNYWVNQYHDTDQEVYREILFSEMIDSKKMVMMNYLLHCLNFIKGYMKPIQKKR